MRRKVIISIIITILTFGGLLIIGQLWTPSSFPVETIYNIEKGTGLNSLAKDLALKKIIKSPFWFKSFSVLFGGPKGIIAGDYVLNKRQNTISIAYRISIGKFDLIPVKITIPEGLNIFEISKILAQKFPKISETDFIKLAQKNEGYLFPDTYFFTSNSKAEDIILEMKNNFQNKIITLKTEINNFKKPLVDIIKMSSIVEKETRTMESRQIVAGILWERIKLGMPLQVDVSFKYINGKVTENLTLQDLKIDSPYNSYLYKGLPPTPISNPGLESIQATVTPIETDFLYFLSDKKGNMYYAKTYKEHLQNKELYLE
jgi:UPF0755 protein